jgi:hypothetical protein
VEVLTAIFKFVHVFSMVILEDTPKRKASPGVIYRDPKIRNPEATQPRVVAFSFPLHAVSSVCRLWRDIAHNQPEYWSRLVIFIDKKFTPLSEVQKQIELSAHVPLDIFVVHRDLDTDDEDDGEYGREKAENENSRAEAVMKLLAPLIPRCRCFVFDVTYSSSLPYISQYFRGHAADLRVLKLQSKIDDSSRPPPVPEILEEENFTFPTLTTIALEGSTFMDACNVSSWREQLKTLAIDTFSITKLDVSLPDENEDDDENDEDELFDLYALAKNLSNIGFIRTLMLSNVYIPWRTGDFDEGSYEIKVNNLLVAGDVEIEFMEEFLLITFGSTLCYYHLAATALTWESIPLVHHLRLHWTPNMGDYQFRRAMTRFFGNRLDLFECEGLSDELLLHIVGHCEPLRRLYITECPNITVKGLKNMITERNRLVAEEDDEEEDEEADQDTDSESIFECDADDEELIDSGYSAGERLPRGFSFRPIHRLVVVGHPKKLTKRDRQWFEDHVKFFHWK